MSVCVVGLGKIGLPLSVQIACRGHHVAGLDISEAVVRTVLAGEPPFPGEPDLQERLQACLADGSFTATTESAVAVSDADVVIVVVPLVVDADSRPDFGALDAATLAIGPHLKAGVLVSYETTVPLGTTRERFAPQLERASGLAAGVDLFVCHSPERVSSGRVFRDLATYPKLVGGIDPESSRRAVAFYSSALEFDDRSDLDRPNGVWDLGSAEAAELAKLAETTYRDVNIAYANELAMIAEARGLDVWPVIDACNSQPFSHIHQPGIAVGGHCIPVYPHFLLAGAPSMRLPSVARDVNEGMPDRYVDLIHEHLGSLDGRSVAVLGLAYRPGVKESAFSGAFALVRAIEERGGKATVHDPMYTDDELRALGLTPHSLGDPCDALIVHTAHPSYGSVADTGAQESGARIVVDGRASLKGGAPGIAVLHLGRSGSLDDLA
jgi:nucleotide sugar dehydrogenase